MCVWRRAAGRPLPPSASHGQSDGVRRALPLLLLAAWLGVCSANDLAHVPPTRSYRLDGTQELSLIRRQAEPPKIIDLSSTAAPTQSGRSSTSMPTSGTICPVLPSVCDGTYNGTELNLGDSNFSNSEGGWFLPTLSGFLPTQLGALTTLTTLNVDGFSQTFCGGGCQLSGSLPTQLGALTALTYQSFENTYLSGSLPTQLGALTTLTYQNLDFNFLSGSLPTQLGALTALKDLSLAGTELSGFLPTQLGALTPLTTLNVDGFPQTVPSFDFNYLSGSLPTQLGALTALTNQSFDFNFLS